MKAYAIIIKDHPISEEGWLNLNQGSYRLGNPFLIERHDACTPEEADIRLKNKEVRWNYPWIGEVHDIQTGLIKRAYPTKNPSARVACFFSHYDLWKKCVDLNEPIFIFEHDVLFTKKIDFMIENDTPITIGLNSPIGATRRAKDFDIIIQNNPSPLQLVPRIDNSYVPQGLAGNSAYVINPMAAKEVLMMVDKVGAWPNDALLCYQNFNFLRVSKIYYTRINPMPSTTSL